MSNNNSSLSNKPLHIKEKRVVSSSGLVDTGPRHFFLHCLPPWGGGGLHDASSAVHLVAEKLTSSEWLQTGYTRTGLRHAVR